jgi:hypothetical protein
MFCLASPGTAFRWQGFVIHQMQLNAEPACGAADPHHIKRHEAALGLRGQVDLTGDVVQTLQDKQVVRAETKGGRRWRT